MRLADLVPDRPVPAPDLDVTGVTADSRKVRPGMVFAALKGARADGAAFVKEALRKGAVAVLADEDTAIEAPVILREEDPRRRLALMAAELAGAQPETIVAVTGTAGKTSVAEFTRQIFAAAGKTAVSVGTLGVEGAVRVPGGLTTPDPVALHQRLADLAGRGVTHVALEASSHGLDQRRLDGVHLAAAAFTNIGRDHMDYHPTPEAYLEAKLRLFRTLQPDASRTVVNPDAPGGAAVLAAVPGARTVGPHGDLLRLVEAERAADGARLVVEVAGAPHRVHLPLIGDFQIDNALIAAGLAMVAGISSADAIRALNDLIGAPGRLELVGRAAGAPVFVDYAHKPEAVTAALSAVRPGVKGRLVVVIGAGGDRDHGKRPLMGKAAADIADVVIVTDDNPRSEDPATIRKAILAAAPRAVEIGDRATAIRQAVAMLRPGDALVVAGKGHEEGQIVGDTVLPFSDRSAVLEALASL
ncbi:UDP-N-acetylmuramoyl-L-alanyl-D-glutamate--2,6-diaminopimelate ligase [Acuticoccus mangrovi]|uniref:UDP-N-acetylmuramoyl-L-alanyl-D-glutamate--2,6-diaminopimelate ligase n=1 Tax=Acuticoccus mangrovi TaxID=2796142 RepID=A0A934IN47_9HYPH|nr:UDP-N-acetylmuramoyl-L-alanyl-D-glutamate--2,6-diaminopimelate ligase [Acuticoccus mangrovi]MBJ3774945.1 UDP-N-acetylmuramoyl-L-alanyl-D-glutamate--2,6-diaminopimelate ligase [Acuticoccus mangrovi]